MPTHWLRDAFRAPLLIAVLAVLAGAAAAPATEIPLDAHGLPLWQVRTWNDVPVRIPLADHEALEALLREVPIASFHREQIKMIWTSSKEYRIDFEPRVTEAEIRELVARGYRVERLPDIERATREWAEARWAAQAAKGGDVLKYGEKGVYHTHAQVGALFTQIEADHPALARDFTWGSSVQGRELWGLTISDNVSTEEAEPEVRLSANIHGDEVVCKEMLLYFADYLTDNYGQPGYEDVTNLVDNYEIHLMPLHNPDGNVAVQRYNANGVDLNRNFPEPAGTYPVQEPENTYFMSHAQSHNFVVSFNGHGGALVMNYPWDYTYTLAPDNDALIKLALEYSTYNLPMYNGAFPQGITNGAAWYVVTGSLQDWSYDQTDCIDITAEISNTKWPAESTLDGYWDDNRESIMHYVKAARYGVNGIVTGSDTGLPLAATVTVAGIDMPVHTDPDFGDYYKLLDTGTYDITYTADGYIAHTEYGVSTTWGTPTVLDVALAPVASGDIAGTVTGGGAPIAAAVEVRTYPGDAYVTSTTSNGTTGAYSVHLVYGDYRLTFTAVDHVSQSHVLDVDLNAAVEVVLFDDDLESGTAGWTGGWDLADPPAGHSPANSMTDSPGTGVKYSSYEDNACEMADAVDLTDALLGTLSFWAKWDIEANWDGCYFQVSVGGGPWEAVATAYTQPSTGQGAQLPAGAPVFEGSQAGWVENAVDLEPWLGEASVRFRFHLVSDSSIQKDGFYFDDFEILVIREAVSDTGGNTPALRTAVRGAYPNPFNPSTRIEYATARAGEVTLAIYDAQGRLVRTLVREHREASVHTAVWDGRDDGGALVPSGVYFAHLRAGDLAASRKLTMLK
jgi:hypothetical protein